MYDHWRDESGIWHQWGPVSVIFMYFEDDHCEIRVALRKGVNSSYARKKWRGYTLMYREGLEHRREAAGR